MRLYDSAWVRLEGNDQKPVRVFKNRTNPALFDVGDYQYDIDGRPAPGHAEAPALSALLSLRDIRDLALSLGEESQEKQTLWRRFR